MATTETREVRGGQYVVERLEYAGQGGVVYTAYQRVDGPTCGFGSIASIGGQWYGRVGTDFLPESINILEPYSTARKIAADAWRNACYHAAYQMILEAYPEAAGGIKDCGNVRA